MQLVQGSRYGACCLVAAIAAVSHAMPLSTAQAQEGRTIIELAVSGGPFPSVVGKTNLPEGTELLVVIKKPWLPDGQQRLARGLAACGEDCFPATGPDGVFGIKARVHNGEFAAGTFSFNGKEFQPGIYPLEILRLGNTAAEIHANAAPLLAQQIELRADTVLRAVPISPGSSPHETKSMRCETLAGKEARTECFHNAGVPVVDCTRPTNSADATFCRDVALRNHSRPRY